MTDTGQALNIGACHVNAPRTILSQRFVICRHFTLCLHSPQPL